MSGRKDRTTNSQYNKPTRSSAEKDAERGTEQIARDQAGSRPGGQLERTKRSKRGWPFAYSDLLMGGIAYPRSMIGKGARITERIVDEMLGRA